MTRIPTLALAALLGAGFPALAQEKNTPPTSTTAPEPGPDPAVLKAMKSQVFVIKYADPHSLLNLIDPLRSGVKGTSRSFSDEPGLKAISIRDFPENLAAIGAAIQRLDVPATVEQSQDIELHIQVLFASKEPVPETDIPPELQKVLATLKGTLAYRGFIPVASFVQRAQVEGRQNNTISGTGVVDPKFIDKERTKTASDWRVLWWASQPSITVPKEGPALFDLKRFAIRIDGSGTKGTQSLADFSTSLSLKEGETAVVGTTVLKDRGLIVVLSAKRVQ